MIKTVLFDLGNVILPFDVTRLAKRLTKHSRFSAEIIISRLWNDNVAETFETGKMSAEEYFQLASDLCEFTNLSFEEFVPIFNEIFEENHDVISLIQQLKSNYPLGLISNANPIHVPHVKKRYSKHLSHFKRVWWSNEAGVRKPDASIYKMALSHFDTTPAEAVFIDDMAENVDGAKALGINAILFQGADLLEKELSKLGVRI
jgi:putative hydrolase of the HAD superfamily